MCARTEEETIGCDLLDRYGMMPDSARVLRANSSLGDARYALWTFRGSAAQEEVVLDV